MAGLLYSLIIWPTIWAFAEDNTYSGYSLPRVEALTGRKWLAVVVVCFFFGLQHVFLPFELEWQSFVYRFISSFLTGVMLSWLYLRQRRLLPIHVIHWAGNFLLAALLPLLMALAPGG
jgi:membrane protease YdiL (CAAX protease family)